MTTCGFWFAGEAPPRLSSSQKQPVEDAAPDERTAQGRSRYSLSQYLRSQIDADKIPRLQRRRVTKPVEENLKMFRLRSGLLVLAVMALPIALLSGSCGSPGSAQTTFSKSSIKGSYAMSFAVAVGGGSAIDYTGGTGVIVADGNGNLSGTESFSDTNGQVCSGLTLSGTYTVNPDGTGVASINYSSSDPQCSGSFTQTLAIAKGGALVKTTNISSNVAQLSGDWTRQ